MLKIAFVLPSYALPVPEEKGGAIETLMTMLLEQNEIYGAFRFVFISPNTVDSVKEWKYSKCYTCSKSKDNLLLGRSYSSTEKDKEILEKYSYDYKAKKITEYENVDFVIMEGDAVRINNCFGNIISRQRTAIHLHRQTERTGIFEEAFGMTIAPSRFVANDWNKYCKENIEKTYLLRNAIRTERFVNSLERKERERLRESLKFGKEDFVVLFCGRLERVKGIFELISAVLSIPDKTVKLLVIGTDSFANGNCRSYAKDIVKIIKENSGRIHYMGYLDNKLLPDYYHCADMQAIPSLWEEAVGLVALEGMCSELPLMITNSGGMVEFVPDGGGMVIKRDNNIIEKFAEGILWMKNHPKERKEMARLSFKHVQIYSSENYYKEFSKMMKWWKCLYKL